MDECENNLIDNKSKLIPHERRIIFNHNPKYCDCNCPLEQFNDDCNNKLDQLIMEPNSTMILIDLINRMFLPTWMHIFIHNVFYKIKKFYFNMFAINNKIILYFHTKKIKKLQWIVVSGNRTKTVVFLKLWLYDSISTIIPLPLQ